MTTVGKATIELRGDATHFQRTMLRAMDQFKEVGRNAKQVDRHLTRSAVSLRAVAGNLRSVGTGLTAAVTLPLAAVGLGASKAAIDFESSFAGIRKTMDLTESEFVRLAEANRKLAREIPVTANELNRIGELGGQLGIEGVENVLKFEKTIAALAVTTDLTADQAALSFAQIANVLQLPQDQIDRLGAAVVGLGNNFATVESQIVEFSTRIAGAGKIAGLSAGDVTGIGTAFASLGVNAEAGGTAVQKVLISMVTATQNGGKALDTFAQTAGTSAEGFRKAFEDDAAGAFVSFVEGLGRQGNAAIGTLEELGLTDQRLTRSFLAAAGAGDLLSRAVQQGNREFQANTALSDEASKRFDTMQSKLKVLRNRVQDVGITLGNALLPVVSDLVDVSSPAIDAVAGLARAFAGLPKPVRLVVVGFAALAAAAGPLVLALSGIMSVLANLALIANTVIGASAIGGIGALLVAGGPVVAGAIAAAGAIGLLVAALTKSGREAKAARKELDEFREALGKPVTIDMVRDFNIESSLAALKVAEIKKQIEAARAAGETQTRFALTEKLEEAEAALDRLRFRASQVGQLKIETEATVTARVEVEEASLSRTLDRIEEVKASIDKLPEGRLRTSQEGVLERLEASAAASSTRLLELESNLKHFKQTAASGAAPVVIDPNTLKGLGDEVKAVTEGVARDLRVLAGQAALFDMPGFKVAAERARILESAVTDLLALDLAPQATIVQQYAAAFASATLEATRLRDPLADVAGKFQEIAEIDFRVPDFSAIGGRAFSGSTIAAMPAPETLPVPEMPGADRMADIASLTPGQRQKFIDGVPLDELTGKIESFAVQMKDLMFGVGQDMITGLINGTAEMGDILKRFIIGLVGRSILGPFAALLKIGSPSKVFAEFGTNLGQGLVVGMKATEPAVRVAALSLASAVAIAVKPPTAPASAASSTIGLTGAASEMRREMPSIHIEALFDPFRESQSAGGQVFIREATRTSVRQGFRPPGGR